MGILIEQGEQVGAVQTPQGCLDGGSLLLVVPEEVAALSQLVVLAVGAIDGLQRVGVQAGEESLGRHGHWCGCEVLHLL